MARGRIALVFLSAVIIGAGVLAVVHLAPTERVSTAAVAKPAGVQPSGSPIAPVPSGVPKAPGTAGSTPARPAVPRRFTGLHVIFPRIWHPATYEVRGPQKPQVQLLCGACPEENSTHTSDARITLMEWTP